MYFAGRKNPGVTQTSPVLHPKKEKKSEFENSYATTICRFGTHFRRHAPRRRLGRHRLVRKSSSILDSSRSVSHRWYWLSHRLPAAKCHLPCGMMGTLKLDGLNIIALANDSPRSMASQCTCSPRKKVTQNSDQQLIESVQERTTDGFVSIGTAAVILNCVPLV